MKTEIRKVYKCDHCKKTMLSGGSMARHEKYCRYNPQNKHKCFDYCKHLKRERIYGGSYPVTKFTCDVTQKEMYSYLIEKKQSIWPYHIKLQGERMPLDCKIFHSMTYDEIESRYGRDGYDGE